MVTNLRPRLGCGGSLCVAGLGRRDRLTGDRFRDLKAGLKLACKRAGIEDVTWHIFRHTFASRLIRNGVDIMTVKELLGHSTVIMTMRYSHTNLEAKVRAVNSICRYKVVTMTPKRRKTA